MSTNSNHFTQARLEGMFSSHVSNMMSTGDAPQILREFEVALGDWLVLNTLLEQKSPYTPKGIPRLMQLVCCYSFVRGGQKGADQVKGETSTKE